jgi:hypothetical protein
MHKRLLGGAAVAALMVLTPIDASAPIGATGVQWSAAQAQASINVSFFFDALAPHGKWSRHGKYGYVFIPAVDRDWAPYTEGRWIWTDHGWYWQSDEPFAWAVYHYGRWLYIEDVGWVWVPGTRWGPAWVSWRRSDDYVGWAPLPPVRDGYVVDVDVDIDIDIDISYWHFVEAPRFLEPDLVIVIIDARDRPEIYERTEFVGTVKVENNIIVNNVIDIDFIEKETKQEVTVHKIESVDKPDAVGVKEGSVEVFNPEIAPETDKEPKETVELKEGTPPAKAEETGEAAEPEAGAAPEAGQQEAVPSEAQKPETKEGKPAKTKEAKQPEAGAAPETTAPEAEQKPKKGESKEVKPSEAPAAEQPQQAPEAKPAKEAKPKKEQPSEAPAVQEAQPEPAPKEKPAKEAKEPKQEQPAEAAPEPEQKPAEQAKEPKPEQGKAPQKCTPEMQAAGAC